jgi:aspartate-semialdehyde dehydrogenase
MTDEGGAMQPPIMRRRKVAVLGASGLVSQRFQQRLVSHPWFELVAVYGSPRTAGQALADLDWVLPEARPQIPDLTVRDLASILDEDADFEVVFSALPADVARRVEKPLASQGLFVFSNASEHRMDSDVPLIVADLNPHHFLPLRVSGDPAAGFLACATNCTVIPAALSLKPLWDFIGLDDVSIRTEQALSGGGIDLLRRHRETGEHPVDIPGEAEKIHEECLSLLGRALPTQVRPANLPLKVEVERVAREFGHIVHITATLHAEKEGGEVLEWMQQYRSRPQTLQLPSAPTNPLCFVENLIPSEMPDPAADLTAGMDIRITNLQVNGRSISFSAWSENTIRGAAGGTVMLAELAVAEGLLGE